MGIRIRVCDGRCHGARFDKCGCWCGGLFHGASGKVSRQAFRDALGVNEQPALDALGIERDFPALQDPADFRAGGLVLDPAFPAAIGIAQAVRVKRIVREAAGLWGPTEDAPPASGVVPGAGGASGCNGE